MKTKKYDGSDVRKILVGMITDKTVCSRIASQWTTGGLFDAQWANIVGTMVVDHYRKFGGPPNTEMSSVFEDWAKSTIATDETIQSVEQFLRAMSQEAMELSSDYLIELAGKYFNKVRMEQEITAAKQELEAWMVEEASERLQKMRAVNLGVGSYSEPAKDIDCWIRSMDADRVRPLVTYREDLGDFFGDAFQRGRFFSFMAPDKSGKTTWMVDFVYRACRAKNRVAFFDVGDTLEEEFQASLAKRTMARPEFGQTCSMPVKWSDAEAVYNDLFLEGVEMLEAFKTFQKISKNQNALRTSFHPSSSLSADDLDGILDDWEREGWIPDVVVVDYADILAPPRGYHDSLDQIDETWKRLRRISQKRHCLLLTATQASALNYGRDDYLLGKKDFSGRKTKLAHVSGMIGINVSDQERELGQSRINKFAWRHRKHSEREYVRVAGCFEIGNPAIISKW